MGRMKMGKAKNNTPRSVAPKPTQAYVEPEVIERIVEVPVEVDRIITKHIIKEVPVPSPPGLIVSSSNEEYEKAIKQLQEQCDSFAADARKNKKELNDQIKGNVEYTNAKFQEMDECSEALASEISTLKQEIAQARDNTMIYVLVTAALACSIISWIL